MASNLSLIPQKSRLKPEFNFSTQTELFVTLKQLQFSGQLILTELHGSQWTIDFHRGYLLGGSGGSHPVKRWYRNLAIYLPNCSIDSSTWQSELSQMRVEETERCWQDRLLQSWVEKGQVTRQQATRVIWSNLVEILFETIQANQVTYELRQAKSSEGIVLIDNSALIVEVQRQWQAWGNAQLTNLNPNKALVIKQVQQLQQSTSAPIFQLLNQLFDGEQTIRDVAVTMKRDLLTVIRSFLPYLQAELVELVDVPDLPTPILTAYIPATDPPLIACIDDSPLICKCLNHFLSNTGYRFIGINDPIQALSVLLALKPDLIFLDLIMPNTNGYEVCDRLRRIAFFRHTPIIILTGNDGVIDRFRAKMVGASGFLSKTKVDATQVQATLNKHLRHCTLNQLTGEVTKQAA